MGSRDEGGRTDRVGGEAMEACTEDTLFAIAGYLPPSDLVSLALTCTRFGGKGATSKKSKLPPGTWPWSMMEEASRRRVSAAKNEVRNPYRNSDLLSVRGEESWIAVHQRLHLLLSSLVFSRIIGSDLVYCNGDIRHVQRRFSRKYHNTISVAMCQEVMISGTHRARFTVTTGGWISLGIFRPIHDWSKKRLRPPEFSAYCQGRRDEGDPAFAGEQHNIFVGGELKKGDVVDLCLALDAGLLFIYLNGNSWGGRASGLNGHYSWAVKMLDKSSGFISK
ncbi:hypothetical protein ACHAXT_002025 [Thalassiosira profunda]